MHGWDEKPCSNYWTTKKNKAALSTSTWSHFGRCNARSRRQPRVTKKVQQSNRNVGLTPIAIVKNGLGPDESSMEEMSIKQLLISKPLDSEKMACRCTIPRMLISCGVFPLVMVTRMYKHPHTCTHTHAYVYTKDLCFKCARCPSGVNPTTRSTTKKKNNKNERRTLTHLPSREKSRRA